MYLKPNKNWMIHESKYKNLWQVIQLSLQINGSKSSSCGAKSFSGGAKTFSSGAKNKVKFLAELCLTSISHRIKSAQLRIILFFKSVVMCQQLWSFLHLCLILCHCVSYSYSKTCLFKMFLIRIGSSVIFLKVMIILCAYLFEKRQRQIMI